jgi:peptidyl-prolyl cis-trans isomerase D
MLEAMRRHSQSFIIYVLFGAIIAVFVISFGPAGQGFQVQDQGFAAKVDGEPISEDEFRRAYGARLSYFQEQSPRGFDMKLAKQLNLKKQVLDELIEQKVLKHAAEKHGLKVAPAELRDMLLKEPAFQNNGRFDFQAYERYVNNAVGTTVARFEEDLAGRILASKFRDTLETGVSISDAEVKADFFATEDKVDLNFVALRPEVVDAPAPTAAEVSAFEKDHAAEIEARYNRDLSKYNEPKKLRARHILIKVAENAPEAEAKTAQEKIEAIGTELEAGKDFAELAKQHSEDSSKDKGGDLGWFGPGMMVKAFEDAANALQPGEVSKPVRSPFGWHLIKLEEVKQETKRELSTVSTEIARQLIVEGKKDQALEQKANKLLAELKGGKAMKDLAVLSDDDDEPKKDSKKLSYKTTGPFNKAQGAVPKIGYNDELHKAVFALDEQKRVLDKPFKIGDRYYVVELKERIKPDDAKFNDKREELRSTALNRKRSEVLRAVVTELREKSDVQVNQRMLAYDTADDAG